MAGLALMMALCFIITAFCMVERWLPLLAAIFTGEAKELEDGILYSGICEEKQGQWDTKYKRRAEEMKQQREARQRQAGALRTLWGLEDGLVDEPVYWQQPRQQQPPPRPVVYVKPERREPVDTEMQDLIRELYDDC